MTTLLICWAALTLPGQQIPYDCLAMMPVPPQLMVTWYDPALGGGNCDADCKVLADGLPWRKSDYYHTAACIPQWHYATVALTSFDWKLLCRDTGGGITFENHPVYGPVIHLDIMQPEPLFGQYDVLVLNFWSVQ